MRPILSEPPLCTMADLKTVLNFDDLLDLNEALDLLDAAHQKAAQRSGR